MLGKLGLFVYYTCTEGKGLQMKKDGYKGGTMEVCITKEFGSNSSYITHVSASNDPIIAMATKPLMSLCCLMYIKANATLPLHRFLASWLRSSRKRCSYECNISYGDNVLTILHQVLNFGTWREACFTSPPGCPSYCTTSGCGPLPFLGTQ